MPKRAIITLNKAAITFAAIVWFCPPLAATPAVIGNCSGNKVGGSHNSQTNDCSVHIEQIPSPTWRILQANPEVKNADGTYTRTFLVEVDSPVAFQNIVFLVRGDKVIDIDVNGVGSGPAIIAGRGTTPDGWHWFGFNVPTAGQFNVGARTSDEASTFQMDFVYNANIK